MQTPTTVPLLISSTPHTSPETFPVLSPTTGVELHTASSATPHHIALALAAASAALPAWRTTPLPVRRDLLLRAADALAAAGPQIIDAMHSETAARKDWCQTNVDASVGMLRGVSGRVEGIEGRVVESMDPGMVAMVVREPYGVVLSIAPWNAPVILAMRSIIFPLAAGNTVIFKSSELCPLTHYLIAQVLASTFPPGTINLLSHSRAAAAEVTAALIRAPEVRKVNFTGSTETGRRIAALAGEALKPITLELGGKAPMVVFEDADVDAAARAAAFAAFHHAGQICMAAEKLLVHRDVAGVFVEKLKAAVVEQYGERQVLMQAGRQRVEGLVGRAEGMGARVWAAGEMGGEGYPNTVVSGVTEEMTLWHEESFAPVVAVREFGDEEEAVSWANHTEYGLSAAVWTRDLARGIRVARRIESGAVHINGPTVHDEVALPHGGVKQSGYGRFGGTWGIDEFLTTKTITFRV